MELAGLPICRFLGQLFTPAHLGKIPWPAAIGRWLGAQHGALVGGAEARAAPQLPFVRFAGHYGPRGPDTGWAASLALLS